MPFWDPKWSISPEQNVFGTNHYYYFHLPIGLFHCAKFKKILTVDPELWGFAIFRPKMVYLPYTIFFFFENFQNHFYLPISPFHWAKFKKNSSSGSTVLRMCNFWTQNCLFPQMSFFFFFRKPANESCFCHSCLTSCQKSKSDINLLVKYWWFNNTEI